MIMKRVFVRPLSITSSLCLLANFHSCEGSWALVPGDAGTLSIPEEASATEARGKTVVRAGWSNGGLPAGGLATAAALAHLPLLVAPALFRLSQVQICSQHLNFPQSSSQARQKIVV